MMRVKLDPRSKMYMFLLVCVLVMNTPNSLFSLLCTNLIMLVGCAAGEYKTLKKSYLVIMGALLLERLLLWVPQSAATMFLLIVIVLIKLYIPILMAFSIVYKTTTISEFMASFAKMRLPAVFVIPFAVMFRFIPTVEEEWNGIRQAMGFRGIGIRVKTTLKHPMQTMEHIIVPLLFSCVNVMDELVAASLARGLDSKKARTCVAKVELKFADYLVFLAFTILLIYSIWR